MNIMTFPVAALTCLFVSCAPGLSGTSTPAFSSSISPSVTVQPSTSSCTGTASATFTTSAYTLDVSVDKARGAAFGTFSINGKRYSVRGTASPASGGTYLDLNGVVDGGRVTGNLATGFEGNYKATLNNYRLAMICTSQP